MHVYNVPDIFELGTGIDFMSTNTFRSKRFLASALITTGLLSSAPLIGEEIVLSDHSSTAQEQEMNQKIGSQLCNQQFRCSKTGFIVHFLPDSKALFIHPELSKTLRADYTVRFDRDIAINVYENPSKHFDVMMHDIQIRPEGFVASVNREKREFVRV